MKQFFLIILALLTILIAVSILPDLFREIRAKGKLEKNDAIALAGLMLALIPFALLLPNANVQFSNPTMTIPEDSEDDDPQPITHTVKIELQNRQLLPVWVTVTSAQALDLDHPASKDDFTPLTERVRLTLFSPSAEIMFHTKPDKFFEENESVYLRLQDPTNAELGNTDVLHLTISNNDRKPTVEVTNPNYATEPPEGESVQIVDVPVTLTEAAGVPIEVSYSTELGGDAKPSNDFVSQVGTLTFEPGDKEESIQILILRDELDEDEEHVEIVLHVSKHDKLSNNDILTTRLIIDDANDPPILTFTSDEFVEDEDANTAVISLKVTPPSAQKIEVPYSVSYEGDEIDEGTVIFAPQTTDKTINIPLLPFQNDEYGPDKIVHITLQKSPNVALGVDDSQTLTANLIIEESDELPTIQFANDNIETVSEDAGAVEVKLTLSNPSGFVPQVTYSYTGGTNAVESEDFTLDENRIVQFDNVTENSFAFTVIDNGESDAVKTIILTLSDAENATLGTPLTKVIHIRDDDGKCIPRPLVDRNNDGEADFAVALLFRERTLDLYDDHQLDNSVTEFVSQQDIACVLDIHFVDGQADWYLIRTIGEEKLGWIRATNVIELLRPAKIDFTTGPIITSRDNPNSNKNGPAICEDNHKEANCGQDYVLGFKSQQVVNGALWFEVVLRDSRSGWLRSTVFKNLELDYLEENLPKINVESE